MTLADSLKPLVSSIRAIPAQLGLRPYSASIVTGINLGAHTGDQVGAYEEIPITESGGVPPRIRQLSDEELALANLGAGLWKVGPFTPDFTTGGTAIADMLGTSLDTGDTRYVKLTGPAYPNGAFFRVVKVGHDHAMHYDLTIAPSSTEV
jgi:hypothetical protein